mgnify:CR=1 FL=1
MSCWLPSHCWAFNVSFGPMLSLSSRLSLDSFPLQAPILRRLSQYTTFHSFHSTKNDYHYGIALYSSVQLS